MKIVKAKRSGWNRVEVLLDNEQKISLAYEVFLKNQLKLNQEISEDLLSLLLAEDQKYQVKQSALNFLSRRHHSRSELRAKLKQKKFPTDLIEQTLDSLEQNNFLDDLSFARIFTDEKIKSKNWGKNKVKAELIKRGISSKIISAVQEEKFAEETEIESGYEIANKKLRQLLKRDVDKGKIKNNLYSFLISRGYDYDSCKQIIGRLMRDGELTDF